MSAAIFRTLATLLVTMLLVGCAAPWSPESSAPADGIAASAQEDEDDGSDGTAAVGAGERHEWDAVAAELPRFDPVGLAEGEQLQVVATTNIIADVVRQVGGEHLDLYTMLPPGTDPHSYQPTPQDLRALNDADVIFINGLRLEEPLALTLEDVEEKVVVVNTGVETIEFGAGAHGHEDEHEDDERAEANHEGADPHTWFSVDAVEVWAHNVAQVLSDLDPANANAYESNADAYAEELEALKAELEQLVAQIPDEQRKLVTDHDALGYLAHEFGFEVVGSVIPSISTLSEPSAQQLAALQEQIREEGVRAIFVGSTVNQRLERQLGQDLGVAVVPIYTGSLSEEGGPADSYIDFMRYNITIIVEALR